MGIGLTLHLNELPRRGAMSDVQRPAAAQPAEIASLQESMLVALLLQQRLPGSAIPIDLLHQLGLGDRDTFNLLNEHLSPLINLEHLTAPVRIVPSAGIALDVTAMAGRAGGNPVVIEFSAPREELGGVRLTLHMSCFSAQAPAAQRNLGTLEVLFARPGDRWLVRGIPTIHVNHPGGQR